MRASIGSIIYYQKSFQFGVASFIVALFLKRATEFPRVLLQLNALSMATWITV